MKVKKAKPWEISLLEAHQNKINFWKEMYAIDTFEKPVKKAVQKTTRKKSFFSIIKNLFKK
ncbi:hypothetical protein IJS77_00515 [bacterium]|nr:hypothetical protein [bacterium]